MDADLEWWRQYTAEVRKYHQAHDQPVPTDDESSGTLSDARMAPASPSAPTQAGGTRPQETTAVLAAEIQAFSARMLASMQEVQGQMQSLTGAVAAQQAQTTAHATALTELQSRSVPMPDRPARTAEPVGSQTSLRARSARPARSQSRARSAAPASQPSQPVLVQEQPVATGRPPSRQNLLQRAAANTRQLRFSLQQPEAAADTARAEDRSRSAGPEAEQPVDADAYGT